MGCIVCWKHSFKEGVLFFILLLVYEGLDYVGMIYLSHFPSLLISISQLLLIVSIFVLIIGVYRRGTLRNFE